MKTPRLAAAVVAASLLVQTGVQSQTQAPPPATAKPQEQRGNVPVFRSSVDLRQLDVTVLDKDRRPVRDLTARDFTITEDGVPQKIDAFSFVEVADTARTDTVWSTVAKSDVVDNNLDSSRVFVLFIDDVWGMGMAGPLGVTDPWGKRAMAQSVKHFVEQMGPDDVGAVVFPGATRRSTPFTKDKAKLVSAIEWFAESNETYTVPCDTTPLAALQLAGSLSSMKNRRKVVVYFGGALLVQTKLCNIRGIWYDVFQVANENNISFYPVDTMGFRPGRGNRSIDEYIVLANHTGGKAVMNTNAFEEGLNRIYTENTSYYLLAYQPTNPATDGRFRRVSVKVNRPGAEVVSNRSYWAAKASQTGVATGPADPDPVNKAIADLLPIRQIPLRAVAAPFRGDGDSGHLVSLALGLSQPGFPSRTRESVDMVVRVTTADGLDFGTHTQLIPISVPASASAETASEYEVLGRVEVPAAGRYELRVAVHSLRTDRRGSVYIDLDVPDFTKDRLSMSGVTVSALPGLPSAPSFAVVGPGAALPTTVRSFGRSDRAAASLVIYQAERRTAEPVSLEIRIQNADGVVVLRQSDTIDAAKFVNQAAPVDYPLPVSEFTPGKYLLTFRATLEGHIVTRDVPFAVR